MSALVARDDLAQVVRRDVGGHAHRDADGAVDEQVGQLGGQHRRLHPGAVVVLDERRRCPCRCPPAARRRWPSCAPRCSASRPAGRRRPSRSCPGRPPAGSAARSPGPAGRGRRTATGRRAGGTCPSPRRRSRRTCGTTRPGVRPISCIVYRIASMDRLEAIAHVRQRAADDDAHGVVEIRARAARPRWGRAGSRSSMGSVMRGSVRSGHPAGRRPGRCESARCRTGGDCGRRVARGRGAGARADALARWRGWPRHAPAAGAAARRG